MSPDEENEMTQEQPRHIIRFDGEGKASCEIHDWTSSEQGDIALQEIVGAHRVGR